MMMIIPVQAQAMAPVMAMDRVPVTVATPVMATVPAPVMAATPVMATVPAPVMAATPVMAAVPVMATVPAPVMAAVPDMAAVPVMGAVPFMVAVPVMAAHPVTVPVSLHPDMRHHHRHREVLTRNASGNWKNASGGLSRVTDHILLHQADYRAGGLPARVPPAAATASGYSILM